MCGKVVLISKLLNEDFMYYMSEYAIANVIAFNGQIILSFY